MNKQAPNEWTRFAFHPFGAFVYVLSKWIFAGAYFVSTVTLMPMRTKPSFSKDTVTS